MNRRTVVALAVGVLALTACGNNAPSTPPAEKPSGTITVFAAASLTGPFDTMKSEFEKANPGTTIRLNYGGSSALATQIAQGAPADVFAAASPATMETVAKAGRADTPSTIATNNLQVVVPKANKAGITSLTDLAKPGVKVALCQPEVPCGAAAALTLKRAKVTVKPVTQEADVKATIAKVKLGEVDAAIVYTTDVKAAGNTVTGIPIPDALNTSTSYPIAALTSSKNPSLALAFVRFTTSPAGKKVLSDYGFYPS